MEKIDILLATYNGEMFLEEQLNSIINQSYTNWNIIISDDGSTDRTLDIIKKYQNKKIKIIESKKHGNPRDNFLDLLNYSDSNLIMFCDQDDIWKPDKIMNAYETIKDDYRDNKPVVSFSDLVVTDGDLKIYSESFFKLENVKPSTKLNFFLTQNCIAGCTTIFNRQMKDALLSIKNTKNIIMHDWAMGIIGSTFGKVIYNEHKDIFYRQHGNNSVGAQKVFSIAFLMNRLQNIHKISSNIRMTQIQAREIYNSLNIDEKNINYELLGIYGNFINEHKFYKIKMILKWKINRNSLIRNLLLLLFC